jgi:hypothetical protein
MARSTTPVFSHVEQVLVPTLQPGDVVVLDNRAVHRQPEVRAAIAAVGASLLFAALQSRLQSYRTGACETESVSPRH